MAIAVRGVADSAVTITTATTWTLPSGSTTNDLMLAVMGGKAYNVTAASGTLTTNYTLLQNGTNGTVANGNGVGSTFCRVAYRVHTGTESAPTCTLSAAPSPAFTAMISLYEDTAPNGNWSFQSSSAADATTTGTTLNYTSGSHTVKAGDMIVVVSSRPDDVCTETSVTLTMTNVTFGTITERLTTNTTTSGNDGAFYVYTIPVTSTTGGTPVTGTMAFAATTGSGDADGTGVFVVVRNVSTAATNTLVSPTTTAAGPASQTKLALVPGLVTRTNAWTNPRVQTANTSITAYTNTTLTWDSTNTRTATGGSARIAPITGPGWCALYLNVSGLTIGRRYTISAYVKHIAGTSSTYTCGIYKFDTLFNNPGYGQTFTVAASPSPWYRPYATGTAIATSGVIFVGWTGASMPAGEELVIDDILIEEAPYGDSGATPGNYFDGVTYEDTYTRKISQGWNGTADASTSYINYIDPAAPAVIITPAATGAKVHFATATGVTVTPTTAADPSPIIDTASASVTISPLAEANPAGIIKDITGSDKTYGTITGGLGIDTAEQQGDATAVVVTPTVASAGTATKSPSATGVTMTPTVAAAGTASKAQTATGITVDPVEAASSTVAKTIDIIGVTVSPTVAATPSGTSKPATATGITVSPAVAATSGAVSKPATATGVTISPASAAAGVVGDEGTASVTVAPSTASDGFVTDAATTSHTASPTTASAGLKTAPATATNVTVSPTAAATPQAMTKSQTATGVTVSPAVAAAGTTSKTATAVGVTVTPATDAAAIVWRHEFLMPDALVSVTNLTGVVANIQDSPTAPDGTELAPTTQTAIAVRMSFENPGQQLRATAGSQTIRVLVTDA